jgi:ABC-type sugar transport system permease subunit
MALSQTPLLQAPGRVAGGIARRIDRLSDRKFAALVSTPGLLVVVLIVAPPVLAVFGMSLFRIDLLKSVPISFVWFRNYQLMFQDPNFLASIPRTILFAAISTAVVVPLSLLVGLALNRTFRGQRLLSVLALLPWAVAPVVTGMFWQFIFQPQFGLATGIVNALGLAHGSIDWLGSPARAMGIAVVANAWQQVPLLALLIGTALRSIPKSQVNAAKMDGAGTWAIFRYITLPGVRNMLLVGAILEVVISLQVFDIIFTLTRGGPGYATTVMYYYIYQSAFTSLDFGYSSAMTVLLVLFILVCSAPLVYLRQRNRVKVVDDTLAAYAGTAPAGSLPGAGGDPALAAIDTEFEQIISVSKFRRRRRMPSWPGKTLVVAGTVLLFVWLLGPILWMMIASVQPTLALEQTPPQLTWQLTFNHFTTLLSSSGWYHSILVSVEIAVFTTIFTILIASLAAYPLARLPVPGKSGVLLGLLVVQAVPAISLAIPVLLLFRHLGLQDTVAGLVICDTAFMTPLAVWILRNVFEDVPVALESAARMDGCTRLGTLFRITIPTAISGVSATAILILISAWNEFLFAVVLSSENTVPVTLRIGYLETPHSLGASYQYDLLAAGGVVAALPCILIVLFFYRRIASGLQEGYVKG